MDGRSRGCCRIGIALPARALAGTARRAAAAFARRRGHVALPVQRVHAPRQHPRARTVHPSRADPLRLSLAPLRSLRAHDFHAGIRRRKELSLGLRQPAAGSLRRLGESRLCRARSCRAARSFSRRHHDAPATLPVERFRPDPAQSRDYVINAHWALYVENYLEGFHIPFVHAGLNRVVDYGSYADELFRYATLQLALAKEGEAAFDLPPGAPGHARRIAAHYAWIFPNLMLNFYPWGLSVNRVVPEA